MQNDALRIIEEAKVCRTYLCESVIKSAGPMLFIVVKVVIGFSTASGDELGGLGALDRQSLERLRLGLVAALGPERGAEALSEALVWAVENPARLDAMRNPAGYLFRVGRTRTRPRLRPRLAAVPLVDSPMFEPKLASGLRGLTSPQRTALVLVHGYGLTLREVGELTQRSIPTVQRHLDRAMRKMRTHLGVEE